MKDPLKSRARLYVKSAGAMGMGAAAVRKSRGVEMVEEAAPLVRGVDVGVARKGTGAPEVVKMNVVQEAGSIFGEEGFSSAVLSREQKIAALAKMDEGQVKGCVKCGLCKTRTHTVFGEGDVDSRIMFIGEGPGADEDASGRPFVGRAGQKLMDQIRAMGLVREQVYIANIVKCRPPENRPPMPEEAEACVPYLERQVEIVRPAVIILLGLSAVKFLLKTKESMSRIRGTWQKWHGIKVMPTFHPSYVLRVYTPEVRAAVWSDLKMVMTDLGMKIP